MASYKKLRIASDANSFAYLRTTNAFSGDFSLTVKFQMVTQYAFQLWNCPSVYWRRDADLGAGDGYKALFMTSGLQIQRGGNEVAANWSASFPMNVNHIVTITMASGTMTISKDGTTLLTYTDPTPKTSGYYGIDAYRIEADYDDVSCTHFSDSFESYQVGSSWTTGNSYGPWTVGSTGGGTTQVISTGLKRRPIVT